MRPWPVCPGGWIRKSNGICVHLLLGLLLLLFLFLPLFRAWPAFVSYCWLPCLSLVAFVPFCSLSLFAVPCSSLLPPASWVCVGWLGLGWGKIRVPGRIRSHPKDGRRAAV